MQFFRSARDDKAARNSKIFADEQKDVLTLSNQAQQWQKYAKARLAAGDSVGAEICDKLACCMTETLHNLSKHAGARTFAKVNADTVNIITVDLHCLLVDQALGLLKKELNIATSLLKSSVKSEVHIITGKGLHSAANKPAVKPAVEQFLRSRWIAFRTPQNNEGIIIVAINDLIRFKSFNIRRYKVRPYGAGGYLEESDDDTDYKEQEQEQEEEEDCDDVTDDEPEGEETLIELSEDMCLYEAMYNVELEDVHEYRKLNMPRLPYEEFLRLKSIWRQNTS